jgi:hypothetical protein
MKKWNWFFYGVFLSATVLSSIGDVLYENTPLKNYYTVLIVFNKYYLLSLFLNILSVLMNVLTPIVVFLYAFNIRRALKFWKIFFFVRIALDLLGHQYELQFIKSAYYQNPSYFLAYIGFLTIPMLPSYIAHYLYAFKNKKR